MSRPALELADIFRQHGEAYRRQHRLPLPPLRMMRAIEICRTAESLDWTRQVVTRLGLTLNEAKTSIKQARKESFQFLGYTFGLHYRKDGHWYLGASPSRGWSAYFSYGTRTQAYRAVDHYLADCVRHFLRRRHKVSSRGTTRFSDNVIFGELGVIQLRQVQLGPRS